MEVVVGIIAKMLVFEYLIPSNELLIICQSNSDIPSITITTNLSLWSCIFQHPPGMYIAISAGAVLLLLVFIPDIFADDKDKDESKKKKSSRRKKGAHAAAHKAAAVDVTPEEPADESLTDEIRRKTDNLLTDDEVEAIRQTVEAGRFDKAAADALRQELIKRKAERDAQ